MESTHKRWIITGAFLIALLSCFLLPVLMNRQNRLGATSHEDESDASPNVGKSSSGNKTVRDPLRDLEARWLIASKGVPNGHVTDGQRKLAKEAVEKLQCSADLVRLILFLEAQSNAIMFSSTAIHEELATQLTNPASVKLRESLVEPQTEVQGGHPHWKETWQRYHEEWCMLAGAGSSPMELEKLSQQMIPDEANAMKLGYYSQEARTDVASAFKATVQLLHDHSPPRVAFQPAVIRMLENLPETTNFQNLADQLPPMEESSDDGVYFLGQSFIRQWTKNHPTDCGDYILQHPEKTPAGLMSDVSLGMLYRDGSEQASGWVTQLPDGTYYDSAALGIIPYLGRADAEKLASRLQSDHARKTAENYIAEKPHP